MLIRQFDEFDGYQLPEAVEVVKIIRKDALLDNLLIILLTSQRQKKSLQEQMPADAIHNYVMKPVSQLLIAPVHLLTYNTVSRLAADFASAASASADSRTPKPSQVHFAHCLGHR